MWIKEIGDIEFLYYARLGSPRSLMRIAIWVPDWKERSLKREAPLFSAFGRMTQESIEHSRKLDILTSVVPQVRHEKDVDILVVRGVLFDEVAYVSATLPSHTQYSKQAETLRP
jgi:hypothetical protein